MKKLILIAISCMALMLTGCKSELPKFQFDVGGAVVEATTNISTDFTVATTNVPVTYFSGNFEKLTVFNNADAYNWLVDNVKGEILKKSKNEAKYDIYCKGFIEWHGLKFSVDEHWQSNDVLSFNNSITEVETPVVYLPIEKQYYAAYDVKNEYIQRFDYVGY